MEGSMKFSGWIMCVQTIILALTGIIIYWYTKETQKIRKETSYQNLMLAEQLRIMKDGLNLQHKKEHSLAEPLFQSAGGFGSKEKAEITLINKGATIKNVGIKDSGFINVGIYPSNVIGSDDKIKFTITNLPVPTPDKVTFEIHYDDQLGNHNDRRMSYYPSKLLLVLEDEN
jgi:hypothetical protein